MDAATVEHQDEMKSRSSWLKRIPWPLLNVLVALLCTIALLVLPLEPGAIPRPRAGYGNCLDAIVIIAIVISVRAIRGGTVAWWGSPMSLLGGACWALIVTFESARAATLHATNNELPLYDSLLLAHHLYILGRDLYGVTATVALAALFVSPLLLWMLAAWMLGRIEAAILFLGPYSGPLVCLALLVAGFVSERIDYGTRFITPIAIDNAQRSLTLWREARQEIARGPSPEIVSAELSSTPDVVFYIVESYGYIAATDPGMSTLWTTAMGDFDARLQASGLSVASGLTEAPVHGGRSWIADASLLMGLTIQHEATYEHMMTLTGSLPHLPSFFAERGYKTVLVKPKDRARPGVNLENPFAFQQTVFAADLDYRGPFYGWGEIPDEFTIERVEDEQIATSQAPVFAFFHLVTSHMPWAKVPPLQGGWRPWQSIEGPRQAVFHERSFDRELAMRFSRWKRILRDDRPEKGPTEEQPVRYIENVLYDIEASLRPTERAARPRITIIMGDHQPPLVAPDSGFEAVVHVIASDPAWLEAWLDRGFVRGMVPKPPPAPIAHRDLFPTLVRALSTR